jgi:hypothetical protein
VQVSKVEICIFHFFYRNVKKRINNNRKIRMIKYKCKINHINEEQDFLRGGETEEEEKN